jgi:hypothetical protein
MAITNSFLTPQGILNNEVFEKILPRPSIDYQDRNITEELNLIVQSAQGVSAAINSIGSIHGAFTGGSAFIQSFAQQIQKSDNRLSNIVGGIEEATTLLQNTIGAAQEISYRLGSVSMGNMSTVFLRSSLEQMTFMPDTVRDFLKNQTNKFPYFQKISESVGGVFYNFVLSDNAVNLAEQVVNSITDKNSSGHIRPTMFMKLFKETTDMMEGGISGIDNLFVRSLPQTAFGKVNQKYSEPVAHGYNLCNDVLQGQRIVQTRNAVLGNLVNSFKDVIRRLDAYFPVTSSVKIQKEEFPVSIAGTTVIVDQYGNKIPTEKPGDFRNLGITKEQIETS